MKKYVLVSVIEFEITHEVFDSYEEAYTAMKNEYKVSDCAIEDKEEDEEACLNDYDGWVVDGYNHDNYVWKIIEVEC